MAATRSARPPSDSWDFAQISWNFPYCNARPLRVELENSKRGCDVSLTEELWSTLAHETGLPFKEVSEIGRRIRLNGCFPKFHRSLPQNVSDIDLANLMIGVMSGLPAQQSHLAIQRLVDAEVSNGDFKHIIQAKAGFAEIGQTDSTFLKPKHTFTEALADLFRIARQGPLVFEQVFQWTWVSVDKNRFGGEIQLHAEVFKPLPEAVLDTIIEYCPAEDYFRGDLQFHGRLSAKTIAAMARTADRTT